MHSYWSMTFFKFCFQFISSSFFVVAQPVKFFAIRFQIESYLFPVGGALWRGGAYVSLWKIAEGIFCELYYSACNSSIISSIRYNLRVYYFSGRFFSWAKKRMAGIASAPPYPIPTPYFTNAGDLPPGYEESTNPNCKFSCLYSLWKVLESRSK